MITTDEFFIEVFRNSAFAGGVIESSLPQMMRVKLEISFKKTHASLRVAKALNVDVIDSGGVEVITVLIFSTSSVLVSRVFLQKRFLTDASAYSSVPSVFIFSIL